MRRLLQILARIAKERTAHDRPVGIVRDELVVGGNCVVKPWNILVTGSSGLTGSEAVEYFDRQGHRVTGADNDMRCVCFGLPGDTLWNLEHLKRATQRRVYCWPVDQRAKMSG